MGITPTSVTERVWPPCRLLFVRISRVSRVTERPTVRLYIPERTANASVVCALILAAIEYHYFGFRFTAPLLYFGRWSPYCPTIKKAAVMEYGGHCCNAKDRTYPSRISCSFFLFLLSNLFRSGDLFFYQISRLTVASLSTAHKLAVAYAPIFPQSSDLSDEIFPHNSYARFICTVTRMLICPIVQFPFYLYFLDGAIFCHHCTN